MLDFIVFVCLSLFCLKVCIVKGGEVTEFHIGAYHQSSCERISAPVFCPPPPRPDNGKEAGDTKVTAVASTSHLT